MSETRNWIRSPSGLEVLRVCVRQRRDGFEAGLAGEREAGAEKEVAYSYALLWLRGFASGAARREAVAGGGDAGPITWLNTAPTAEFQGYLSGAEGGDEAAELYMVCFQTLPHWIAGFADGLREYEARNQLQVSGSVPSGP